MDYSTHLATSLPALLRDGGVSLSQLRQHRGAAELLLTLDLERLRTDLVAALPRRPGGRKPFDQVVLARSLLLCVIVGGGRLNAWGRRLAAEPLLRVLIGLGATAKAPAIGTHYAFMRRVLRASTPDAADPELAAGHGGLFERSLADEPRDAADNIDGACERMRKLIDAGGLPGSLDARLIGWVVDVGVRCLVDADLLVRRLDLAVDGTVHGTHACRFGVPSHRRVDAADTARPTPEPAEAAPTATAAERTAPDRAAAPERAAHRTKGAVAKSAQRKRDRDRRRGTSAPVSTAPASPGTTARASARPRVFSDPTASFRYSNGSGSVEFGHLGIAATTRVGNADVPLFSAFARPHHGETPESMRAIEQFVVAMGKHFPEHKVRSVIGDAGFDAAAFYTYVRSRGADPIVAIGANPLPVADGDYASDGRPTCAGGAAMQLHSRASHGLRYQCPAQRMTRAKDGPGSKAGYVFDATRCPLGAPCAEAERGGASGPFRVVPAEQHPRLHLPVPRGSDEFITRMKTRTAVERYFAHQHHKLKDRSYRRRHIWQFMCAMHVLWRQAAVVRAARPDAFAAFWADIRAAAVSPPAADAA